MTPIEGVDYAFTPHPAPSALVAAGKHFACRYGGPGSGTKLITPDEIRALAAAGIWTVANAEGSASGLLGGWSAGVSWATSALAAFRAAGMPKGRPIYFSVDFDPTSAQWPTVADALKGAASIVGADCVGVYGGRHTIEWAMRDKVAAWYWQTYAWSGGYWVPGTHLQQYRNGVFIGGADCDLDRAMQPDYGQWQPGISGGGDMPLDQADVQHVWQNYLAPGGYNMQDHLLNAEKQAAQANAKVDALTAAVAELKAALSAGGATIDAESLAAAMRAIIRDELDKTHLAG